MKPTDKLFERVSPEVKRLRQQAAAEIRREERKKWAAKNLKPGRRD